MTEQFTQGEGGSNVRISDGSIIPHVNNIATQQTLPGVLHLDPTLRTALNRFQNTVNQAVELEGFTGGQANFFEPKGPSGGRGM